MPGALIGGGISALGGLLSSGSQNDALAQAAQMAQFNPFNVTGAAGNVAFGDDSVNLTPTGAIGDIQSQLGGLTGGLFGGGGTQNFAQFAQGLGNEQLPGLFAQSQQALGQLPTGAFQQFMQGTGANVGALQGAGFGNLAAGGFDPNAQRAQNLFGMAQQKFGQNFGDVRSQRLGLLREQAAPFEERAQNQFQQQLFDKGIFNESTPGGLLAESFGRGLGQADFARQLNASDFAQQQQNINFGQGQQLFGQALGAQQQDIGRALGFGGLGLQQLGGAQAGLGGMFGGALDFSNLGASRGQQRLGQAQNIFGFGQQLGQQQFGQGLQGLGGLLGINADMRQLAALGGNLGSAGAQAGAAAGGFLSQQTDPLGTFLGSLGGGIGSSPGFFGSQPGKG